MAARTLEITQHIRDTSIDKIEAGKKAGRTYTTTNSGKNEQRQSITTSEVTITIPASIGDAGLCVIENHDATNFIKFGFATGNYVQRIPKGQSVQLWLEPTVTTLYAIADTATSEASFVTFER